MATTPAWHPDFRVTERLPDTKPVRTIFFINSAAVLLATCLAIYIGYREVGLRALRADTESAALSLKQNKPGSDQAVELFKKFQEQEKGILALQDFLATRKLVVSDFVLHLGATLPSGVRLTTIDYKPAAVVVRGDIAGAADEASGLVYTYIDLLRKDKELAKSFENISLSSISREAATGRIRFEAALKFKGGPIKAQGGGK